MSSRFLFCIFLLLFLVTPLQGCGKKEEAGPEQRRQVQVVEQAEGNAHDRSLIRIPQERLKMLNIRVETARRGKLPQVIAATAVIEVNPYRLAHISPRIPGRIVAIYAKLGDEVKKGQKLALLDSLELGEAKAQYLKAQTKLEVASTEYERQKTLYEKKIAAQKSLLAAQGEYLEAKTEFEAAQAKLRLIGLSETEIEDLRTQRKITKATFPILSSFSGTIVENHIAVGEVVNESSKLYTIADLSIVWILLDIYEKDLAKIEVGHEVSVSVASYPQELFRGKITYISDLIDEKTRTAKVRVEVPNPRRRLKPGMFAEAKIITHGLGQEAILVPQEAIFDLGEGPIVFVKQEDGFLAKRVTPGEEGGGFVEIRSGLSPGEEVVVEGGYSLKTELLREQIGEE